jgi:hypothetical protein
VTTPLRNNRDFNLLWSGLAVSVIGTRISTLAYPLLVVSVTHSPAKARLGRETGRAKNEGGPPQRASFRS